ncbi:MAG: hypothetical protein BMS9Abin07_1502 [Acidimicrobiia bacterium]|nr:MAG: hypothetical protein BMS9Abin07_1502 [Acidimicrobiia bacterium]
MSQVSSLKSRVASPARDSRLATRDSLPTLQPGQVASLVGPPGYGLTRLGLTMLAGHSGPVAYVDVRGWFNPIAAWEVGIDPDRLHVVRCDDILRWSRAAAALLGGVEAVFAEVPGGVKDAAIRKLGALARTRRAVLYFRLLRGGLPSGVAHLSLEGQAVSWDGADRGHGSIAVRRSVVTASGKTMRGTTRTIEVEDDGTDAMRVVSRVGASQPRVATG